MSSTSRSTSLTSRLPGSMARAPYRSEDFLPPDEEPSDGSWTRIRGPRMASRHSPPRRPQSRSPDPAEWRDVARITGGPPDATSVRSRSSPLPSGSTTSTTSTSGRCARIASRVEATSAARVSGKEGSVTRRRAESNTRRSAQPNRPDAGRRRQAQRFASSRFHNRILGLPGEGPGLQPARTTATPSVLSG